MSDVLFVLDKWSVAFAVIGLLVGVVLALVFGLDHLAGLAISSPQRRAARRRNPQHAHRVAITNARPVAPPPGRRG